MAYRPQTLGVLVRLDPANALAVILDAWRAGGSIDACASRLGCSRRTLFRWLSALRAAGLDAPRGAA
jgi:transposase-like protein